MPAQLRSVSNPGLSTRQQPRAKPRPVPTCLNNELSIDTTSSTTSMGPQPRPKPCLIPAPLNEGLSIDTTSPMTSIHRCNDWFPHSPDMAPKGRLGLSLHMCWPPSHWVYLIQRKCLQGYHG